MKNLKKIFASMGILVAMGGIFTACKDHMLDKASPDGNVGSVAVITYGSVRGGVTNITASTTWASTNSYLLKGYVRVVSPAVLTINAGTLVNGDKTTIGTLIIEQGAQISANGTASSPIVFTSNQISGNKKSGDWGGVVLCGFGQVNTTGSGNASVGGVSFPALPVGTNRIEGIIPGPEINSNPNTGVYGGSNNADNSGTMTYCRIEYAGSSTTPNNETNGLTFGGVGSGTSINHIQVAFGNDDAFEWFGGAVNCSYLFSYRNRDDDFDTDFGYSGVLQFLWGLRDPAIGDNDKLNNDGTISPGSGSNGFESDNNNTPAGGSLNNPRTQLKAINATIIGPDKPSGVNPSVGLQQDPAAGPDFTKYGFGYVGSATSTLSGGGYGALNRRNSLEGIFNSVIVGWPKAGYDLIPDSTKFATSGTFASDFVTNTTTTAYSTTVAFRNDITVPTPAVGPNRKCTNGFDNRFLTLFATVAERNQRRGSSNMQTDLGVSANFWSLTGTLDPTPSTTSVLATAGSATIPGAVAANFRGAFSSTVAVGSFSGVSGWNIPNTTGTSSWVRAFTYGN